MRELEHGGVFEVSVKYFHLMLARNIKSDLALSGIRLSTFTVLVTVHNGIMDFCNASRDRSNSG